MWVGHTQTKKKGGGGADNINCRIKAKTSKGQVACKANKLKQKAWHTKGVRLKEKERKKERKKKKKKHTWAGEDSKGEKLMALKTALKKQHMGQLPRRPCAPTTNESIHHPSFPALRSPFFSIIIIIIIVVVAAIIVIVVTPLSFLLNIIDRLVSDTIDAAITAVVVHGKVGSSLTHVQQVSELLQASLQFVLLALPTWVASRKAKSKGNKFNWR